MFLKERRHYHCIKFAQLDWHWQSLLSLPSLSVPSVLNLAIKSGKLLSNLLLMTQWALGFVHGHLALPYFLLPRNRDLLLSRRHGAIPLIFSCLETPPEVCSPLKCPHNPLLEVCTPLNKHLLAEHPSVLHWRATDAL